LALPDSFKHQWEQLQKNYQAVFKHFKKDFKKTHFVSFLFNLSDINLFVLPEYANEARKIDEISNLCLIVVSAALPMFAKIEAETISCELSN